MIGIIDSGSGGLNVIKECIKYYKEDFVYFLDNKNCPYGNKSPQKLKQILKENINYLINNYELDLIIIACNTMSALFDYSLMLDYRVPILKTIPKIKCIKNKGENILLFATKNTIKNSKELKLIKYNYPLIKTLQIKGIPKLIDNYLTNYSKENKYQLNKILKYNFLKNIKFKINNNLDNNINIKKLNNINNLDANILKTKFNSVEYISLGCTHFKHIECFLKQIFNQKIKFFECEKDVANNSKWLVRKNKKQSTLKLILSEQDLKLEQTVFQLFKE